MPKLVFSLFLCGVIVHAWGQSDGSSYKAEGWPGAPNTHMYGIITISIKRERALAADRVTISQIGSVTYDKLAYPIMGFSYIPA